MTFYYGQHAPYSFDKLSIDWSGYDLPALNGQYANDELDVTVSLEQIEGQNYLVKMNGKKRNAILREPDLLTVNGGYTAHVQRDENGQITGLLVDGGRVKRVWFERE